MSRTAALDLCKMLACALGIWWLLLPNHANAAEELVASDNEKYSILASILSMHQRQYQGSGLDIKIFEIGGGDPAMNGSFIYICMAHAEKSYIWKTGLNVREISKIDVKSGNRIMLHVNEDYMNTQGAISSRRSTYQIQFRMDAGVLQHTLVLEKK